MAAVAAVASGTTRTAMRSRTSSGRQPPAGSTAVAAVSTTCRASSSIVPVPARAGCASREATAAEATCPPPGTTAAASMGTAPGYCSCSRAKARRLRSARSRKRGSRVSSASASRSWMGHGVARRDGAVRHGERLEQQPRAGSGQVVAALGRREPLLELVGQAHRRREPARLTGRLVKGQEAPQQEGVVVEEGIELGLAVAPGVPQRKRT